MLLVLIVSICFWNWCECECGHECGCEYECYYDCDWSASTSVSECVVISKQWGLVKPSESLNGCRNDLEWNRHIYSSHPRLLRLRNSWAGWHKTLAVESVSQRNLGHLLQNSLYYQLQSFVSCSLLIAWVWINLCTISWHFKCSLRFVCFWIIWRPSSTVIYGFFLCFKPCTIT